MKERNAWLDPSRGRALEQQKFLVMRALTEIVKPTVSTYTPKNGTVIEIGAGTAYGRTMMPSDFQGRYLAVDINIENLSWGKRMHGLQDFIAADAQRLPFVDSFTDSVIAQDTLDTLPNLGKAFASFKRVLKPGGHIIHFATVQPFSEKVQSVPTKADPLAPIKAYQRILQETAANTNLLVIESDIRTADLIGARNKNHSEIRANTFIQLIGQVIGTKDERLQSGLVRENAMAYVFVAKKP